MGHDEVLPIKVFGKISQRFRAPFYAVLTTSVVSLMALVIDLAVLTSIISFRALIVFSVVNLSIVKHYCVVQDERSRAYFFNHLLLPLTGFDLTLWLWTRLAPRTLPIGLI